MEFICTTTKKSLGSITSKKKKSKGGKTCIWYRIFSGNAMMTERERERGGECVCVCVCTTKPHYLWISYLQIHSFAKMHL